MVENVVRIVIVILIFIVVIYYAYLLAQARVILKHTHKYPTDESMKRIAVLEKKFIPTVCYLLCMIVVGILYFVGIEVVVMLCLLMILNVIVAFIGDKMILSKTDLKKK